MDELSEQESPPQGAAAEPLGAHDPSMGRRFGAYVVRRRVGTGGMSGVYEAVHDQRRRPEALKVLKGRLCADPHLVERFQREVRALAALDHDHIVPIYDAGKVDDEVYYTMPLLPGPSLEQVFDEIRDTGETVPGTHANEVLDRHGFPPAPPGSPTPELAYARRMATVIGGVVDALAVIHGAGLLHRDVKPSNMMFDQRGRLVLMDFGLVRTDEQRITETGQPLGTPAYMSPEQILPEGIGVDGRTDVYSLGATLFEAMTLRLPHEGASLAETLTLVLKKRAPSIRQHNPRLTDAIETIVARALEPRMANRYPSAAALRDDLRRFAQGEAIRTRPISRARRATQWVRRHAAVLGILLLAAVGGATWYLTRPGWVSVRSYPSASVSIDGVAVGLTPLGEFAVAPGRHVVELRQDGFRPRREEVTLRRMMSLVLDRELTPLEGSLSAEYVSAAMSRRGVEIPVAKVEGMRSGGGEGPPALNSLFPRGKVSHPPDKLLLWADDIIENAKVVLSDAAGGDPVAEFPVREAFKRYEIPLEPDVRAKFRPGVTWSVRVVGEDGAEQSTATFEVLTTGEWGRIEQDLDRRTAAFEEDNPVRHFVRGAALLEAGALGEAYDEALALLEKLGNRRDVADLALSILDRASLRGSFFWVQWLRIRSEAVR